MHSVKPDVKMGTQFNFVDSNLSLSKIKNRKSSNLFYSTFSYGILSIGDKKMKKILTFLLAVSMAFTSVSSVQLKSEKNEIYAKENETSFKDGIYTLESNGKHLGLDRGKLVMSSNEKKTEWVLNKQKGGTYSITDLNTGVSLGVSKKNLEKAKITYDFFSDKNLQKWELVEKGKGTYSIRPAVNTDYSLKVKNDKVSFSDESVQAFTINFVRDIIDVDDVESSIDTIKVDKESDEKGAFYVKVKKPESNATVSGLAVEVYPEGNESLKKTFISSLDSNGNISSRIYARDFNYESGKYTVNCSLLLDGCILSEIGSYSCTVCDALENLKKNIENFIEVYTPYGEDWQVYLRDLEHDKEFGIAVDSQQSASMIKMFVAGTCLDNYDSLCKKYSKEFVDININNVIVVSSNPAWTDLVRALGDGSYDKGFNMVNDWAHEHGYNDVETQNEDSHNFCSTKDTTQFFKDCYTGKYEWGDRLMELFHKQAYRHKIPAGVPVNVKTGNKTGDLFTTENDTCIVYAPHGTYILSVMSTGLADIHPARRNIRSISKMVYEFLNT